MRGDIDALQARLGHRFADPGLLERALTHSSYGDGRGGRGSNERLEFLGDRVLGLLAAERLLEAFAGVDEGGLAPRLNALVNRDACARVARAAGLDEALRMSPGEVRAGGREKPSILGDACEAVIAALYLDGGLAAARNFFDRYWAEEIISLKARPRDPKSALQEWAARIGHGVPEYALTEQTGPDHRPRFAVEVRVGDLAPVLGEGGSKQEAQRAAAAALLEREGARL